MKAKKKPVSGIENYRRLKRIGVALGVGIVIFTYFFVQLLLGPLYQVNLQQHVRLSLQLPSLIMFVYWYVVFFIHQKYNIHKNTEQDNDFHLGIIFTSAPIVGITAFIGCIISLLIKF